MKKLFFLVILTLVLIIALVTSLLKEKPDQADKAVEKIEYSAWLPSWDEERSLVSLNGEAGKKLNQILPVWYQLDSEGVIQVIPSSNQETLLNIFRTKGIKVIPTVVNSDSNGFNASRVTAMLTHPEETITTLIKLAKEHRYDGWDLDLEAISKSDRQSYAAFVAKLAERFHQEGLLLSVTVHAQQDSGSHTNTDGQDIEKLGLSADQLRIMAYDFHSADSNPGPITPIIDLEKTINYFKSLVDVHKLVVCLPTYGYDWKQGKMTTSYQYQDAKRLLAEKSVVTVRDIDSDELRGSYDGHQIWLVDSETLKKLVQISMAYGINKICFWHLGGEDDAMWKKI